MIQDSRYLQNTLSEYASPKNKIMEMVRKGELIPIRRGLFETDKSTSGHLLASSIYGPSYLSFEFALSFHGLIPERTYVYTSATFGKNKHKEFSSVFGTFTYDDIPSSAYPYDIQHHIEDSYSWYIASPEKALCDVLYKATPVKNTEELRAYLFEDLRIDEVTFAHLNVEALQFLCSRYGKRNLRFLQSLLNESSLNIKS